jgi:hypothetical protein
MKTLNQALIRAPLGAVYAAALHVVEWPKFLPHYRWVKILEPGKGGSRVEMAASRDGFPCLWQAQQVPYPRQHKIYFRHTRSTWSQGMEVWWILKALPGGATEVTISHDMPPAGNPFASWFRQRVVGDFFVHDIADKTLKGFKLHLEKP